MSNLFNYQKVKQKEYHYQRLTFFFFQLYGRQKALVDANNGLVQVMEIYKMIKIRIPMIEKMSFFKLDVLCCNVMRMLEEIKTYLDLRVWSFTTKAESIQRILDVFHILEFKHVVPKDLDICVSLFDYGLQNYRNFHSSEFDFDPQKYLDSYISEFKYKLQETLDFYVFKFEYRVREYLDFHFYEFEDAPQTYFSEFEHALQEYLDFYLSEFEDELEEDPDFYISEFELKLQEYLDFYISEFKDDLQKDLDLKVSESKNELHGEL